MQEHYIPYSKIASELPLSREEIVLVASDISRLAFVSMKQEKYFFPDVFIDCLKEKVCTGTLLIPAFTDKPETDKVFDIRKAKPLTGALSESVFKRNDFKRTSDPFHSFFVWGKHQEDIIKIRNKSTFGEGSVFAFLHSNNAKMLMIDVDMQHSFTFAHYVEECEQVFYRHYKKYNIRCLQENGGIREEEFLFFEKKAGVSNTLNNLEQHFIEGKITQTFLINSIPFLLTDLGKAFDYIQMEIKNNKARNLYYFSPKDFIKQKIKSIVLK
ncbi:MAG: AAC(3) family N-acetyltransferase [Bacteroidales bacterium]|jgi:aminoglycoside 3-N-acetyltransferase|nr:AAC(3) family N-acetyltransferase [Bacteroidales bacterium]MDD4214974.1 AAC(3) family N-acetyltransferase [Bacteroidales bacterium]